ncbi:RAB6-interacting golgin-like isoform X2 [Xyrauchen texanus]|uniref:RAB6-interacting golgin-like isoform X2 n=1 Tax=Xyrauchen texanus TaxID=154827 RepID=UPI0022424037|nr:RAB6-interacting golgin-like isoform X2 [Xyrauchen texanus]
MAAWAGFSEEELLRMQQNGESTIQTVPVTLGRGRRPAPTNRSRLQLQRERALHLAAHQKVDSGRLPPEQQLSKPPDPPAVSHPAALKSQEEPKLLESELFKHESEFVKHDPEPSAEAMPTVILKELDKQEVEFREKNRLQQLQWEQRIMEEKNKRKKALLTKTIAEKKRLEKAEVEYVAAKLDLHRKTELKEQLTEHLCAIIQQNELRKACKLEELMIQLELSDDEVPMPEVAEQEDKQREGNPQPITENGPAAGIEGCTDVDSSNMNKDSSITEPKICQDNQESRVTDVSADVAR